jgi:hypothetical protein
MTPTVAGGAGALAAAPAKPAAVAGGDGGGLRARGAANPAAGWAGVGLAVLAAEVVVWHAHRFQLDFTHRPRLAGGRSI